MKFSIINIKGDKVSDITADKNIFAIKPNNGVVRQAILSELNNMRQGTHSSKNRALVKGGGKKPWKQKGRGVARAGTIRSPLWRGGGTVFGPEPHAYSHKLPKKLSKLARKSVLSAKALNDEIIDFINSIRMNKKPLVDGIQGMEALKLAAAISKKL